MNELKIKRIGYKGFEVNDKGELYCRNMVFHVGEIAGVNGGLEICKNGIHFCWNINDVNDHYTLKDHVICEVEPLGDIVASDDGKKCCTNLIKIVKMLTAEEVLRLSNSGRENTGYMNSGNRNSGDWNSGNWNSGDWNSGNRNSGNRNSGNRNSGNWNSGHMNSGDWNSGDWNSGDWNSGDWNSGNWNSGDWNSGFFNENKNKCFIFDKISGFTVQEFMNSEYYYALTSVPFVLTEWVKYSEEEKASDKSKALIGGYLKTHSYKEACATWWSKMIEENKKLVQEIPNFDAEKFYRITGIRVEADDNGTI